MRWGILLAALGVACYIVHAVLMVERRQEPARRLLSCDALTPSPEQLRTEQGENSTFILRS